MSNALWTAPLRFGYIVFLRFGPELLSHMPTLTRPLAQDYLIRLSNLVYALYLHLVRGELIIVVCGSNATTSIGTPLQRASRPILRARV